MHKRILLTIALSISCIAVSLGQGAHDLLIKITQDKADAISASLGLTDEAPNKLKKIYVRYAIAVEDLIVSAEPDVTVVKKIEFLEKSRDNLVKSILDEEQEDVYDHLLEEMATQQRSEFDSLQVYLSSDTFREATITYYDENVAPYVLFYHQTYFRPAIKQKHTWKINQSRRDLEMYIEGTDTAGVVNIDKSLNTLKKIRKRYKDQLDYITVALGSMEREWTRDYIKMVQSHFDDDIYQKIADHTWSMNAYGMHYIVGELSMVLFDVWNPRSYLESREALMNLFIGDIN